VGCIDFLTLVTLALTGFIHNTLKFLADMKFDISEIDFKRFNIITAKATLDDNDSIEKLLNEVVRHEAKLVIIRVPSFAIQKVQEIESIGGFLTDVLIYYKKKIVEFYDISLPNDYKIRVASINDQEHIEKLALESFKGYAGHYHADNKLDKESCDLVYSSWASSSCSDKNLADSVLVVEILGQIAAFATVMKRDDKIFEGVLFGVSPDHRRKGLHLLLMKISQNWGVENNLSQMITSTQITNIAVQKNWCRAGFEPSQSFFTFHLWT
jgi:hypothetical protein